MNRRGDIPVVILVVGVFLICGLALFSFYNSSSKVRNSFVGLETMDEMNLQIERNLSNGQNPTGLYFYEEGKGVVDLGQMGKFASRKVGDVILFSANLTFYIEQ